MARIELDELDQQLIAVLGDDARVSNRRIAADLGVTEGTVRGRIKRLQQEGLMAFTAITSYQMESRPLLAFISIAAEIDKVREVANRIAEISAINAVMVTMGEFNILAISVFNDMNELASIGSDQILGIPGVHHIETSIAVRTEKYNTRMAKITAAQDGGDDSAGHDCVK